MVVMKMALPDIEIEVTKFIIFFEHFFVDGHTAKYSILKLHITRGSLQPMFSLQTLSLESVVAFHSTQEPLKLAVTCGEEAQLVGLLV